MSIDASTDEIEHVCQAYAKHAKKKARILTFTAVVGMELFILSISRIVSLLALTTGVVCAVLGTVLSILFVTYMLKFGCEKLSQAAYRGCMRHPEKLREHRKITSHSLRG